MVFMYKYALFYSAFLLSLIYFAYKINLSLTKFFKGRINILTLQRDFDDIEIKLRRQALLN